MSLVPIFEVKILKILVADPVPGNFLKPQIRDPGWKYAAPG
jgi:hypothetical protein